jgi:hypothetical protein
MECIPTCTDADNPPKYPPMGYPEYMVWYRNLNYGGQDGAKGSDGVKLSAG